MVEKAELTIEDIARAAGVSVSTVSRILNNKPDVAESTKERVQEIINQFGYEPHSQAKRLAAGESRTIALFDPLNRAALQRQPINQLHLDFMIGAATAAGEADYFFNVVTAPTREQELLKVYRSAQVDGTILMEIYMDDPRVNTLRSKGLPFVMIGKCADNTDLSFIDLDFGEATQAIFNHLVEHGHTNIGFIGFHNDLKSRGFGPAVRAWSGYQLSLEKHRLDMYLRETNYTSQEMAEATNSLLREQPQLTAIVALTDAPMVGVIGALRESGHRVPEDVTVIGLAIDRIAEIITPSLTAVRFPSYEMGYEAASNLIKKLNGLETEEQQIEVDANLIERGSSGPKRDFTQG